MSIFLKLSWNDLRPDSGFIFICSRLSRLIREKKRKRECECERECACERECVCQIKSERERERESGRERTFMQ